MTRLWVDRPTRRRFDGSARLGIEPNRNRPIINEGDFHLGAENAVGDFYAQRSDVCRKMLVEAVAVFWRGGGRETRAVALGLGCERELADDKCLSARIEQRAAHATTIVPEDAQVRDFAREPFSFPLRIASHGTH